MRIRAAVTLFGRSAKSENSQHSSVSAREPMHGRSVFAQIIFNNYSRARDEQDARRLAEIKRVSEEVDRVRKELSTALNSGQSDEYRKQKMDELFPTLKALETKLGNLFKARTHDLHMVDLLDKDEHVKITHLKS